MELPQQYKEYGEKAIAYIRKEWLQLAFAAVATAGIAAMLFMPAAKAWASSLFTKTEVVQERTVTNALSDEAKERIADLEQGLSDMRAKLEADRQDRLALTAQFQKAQAEVAKANDSLAAQAQKLNQLAKQAASGGMAASDAPIQLSDGKVHINTATAAELDALPGIGPSTAEKIIAYRTERGPFRSIEELKNVSGIGDATYAKLQDLIAL